MSLGDNPNVFDPMTGAPVPGNFVGMAIFYIRQVNQFVPITDALNIVTMFAFVIGLIVAYRVIRIIIGTVTLSGS